MAKEIIKIIISILLFSLGIYAIWQGGSWVWNWFATHESVCTKYSIIENIESYQTSERRSEDHRTWDSKKQDYVTETDYYWVTVTKWRVTYGDGQSKTFDYLPENYTLGNEVCTQHEWREKKQN